MDQMATGPAGVGPSPQTVGERNRRRPTGTPPPLPRSIGITGKIWLIVMIVMVVVGALWLRLAPYVIDHIDGFFLRAAAELRTSWLNAFARWINTTTSQWGLAIVGLGTVVLLIVFRRFRHLIILLISLALVELAVQLLTIIIDRPRPWGVTQIAGWEGSSAPSLPVAALTAVLVGMIYTLVPPGRLRLYAKIVVAVLVFGLAAARVLLGVDSPSDVLLGAVIGVAIPVSMFRTFAPNDVYPIRYGKHGKSAHLDVTGARGEAIRVAVHDQLGYRILEMEPVGLEGSGGSTPLRIRVVDEERGTERKIFAKLYAKSHVRADRWYKLGRTMLYGSLEDEKPFQTVRRFVEYEDYTLRLLGEYGFPTPEALGIVEITPEREYLIAMEFFEGAVEIGEAEVDERVIDQGLQIIRRMWDVGLAHRDVKPANLMVLDDDLKVIDVFFVQVRPSPWRQAVDLANMMLVLALRSDAETVYRHALTYFSPDELGEAFAAARGVASPTQLHAYLKRDGRDLLAQFRAMAPQRKPISVQRWSVRRVLLIVATLLIVVFTVTMGVQLFFPNKEQIEAPICGANRAMYLMAQAVPTAEQLPCIEERPPIGWSVQTATVHDGKAFFALSVGAPDSPPVVTVTLTETCPPVEPGTQQIEAEGGCVSYASRLQVGTLRVPSFIAGEGLNFTSRSELVDALAADERLKLCGAGVNCE